MRLPSGVKNGAKLAAFNFVTCRLFVPSAFIVQTSKVGRHDQMFFQKFFVALD